MLPDGRLPHSVIDGQPSLGRFNRRRTEANLVRIPPSAAPRLQNDLVAAPMPQVRRVGDPHVRAERRDRPMNEGPAAANPPRQQSRILILRRHDHAESLKAPEVFGERQ